MNPYKSKLRDNKVKYSTASRPYKTTHNVKVPFGMPKFYRKVYITHRFHIENAQGDSGFDYDMILCPDQMVKLGLKAKFGRQIL